MEQNELLTDIQYLKGVGPKRAALFRSELGIETVDDLIHLFPTRYVDRSRVMRISDISADSPFVQFRGKVVSTNVSDKGKRLEVQVSDGSGEMLLVFFRGLKYTRERLAPGAEFLFYGKPTLFNGRLNIVHPEIDAPPSSTEALPQGVMTGVYPSTERLRSSGITGKVMNRMMASALNLALPWVEEPLPEYIMKEKGLVGIHYALRNIHFPSDPKALEKASRRLKWDELFFLQLSLLKHRFIRSRNEKGFLMPKVGAAFNVCYRSLPYDLTGAQKRVIREIREDMNSGHQMNRLLQGDVGSGKTLVAVLSCLIAAGNNFQSCIMAPTEVLARQHFANISRYLAPTGVVAAILTGSTRESERRRIHQGLQDGSIDILVGTHALIEDTVKFRNLGFAVVDEQHRFGVQQRAALWSKTLGSIPPHVLVMTATPIPRTLAMTLYGDLDVSTIDEMPPGRKPIQTLQITERKRHSLNKFMKDQIAQGRQVFVVYPLIFENEKLDLHNLEQGYEQICTDFPFPPYKVAIVHGKQRIEDKNFNMDAFAAGRANILVSTTVIEVGVDVPNASVMVIENAERFGLSQLHQLRGRVGRGSDKSYCVLVRGEKLGKEAQKRIDLMCETEDGFILAEEDMKMRGPGDLEGTQQSGLPVALNIASLAKDGVLLSDARGYAELILSRDPLLESDLNAPLQRELRRNKYSQTKDFSKIS